MPNRADFDAANASYVAGFSAGGKPMPPKRQALVIACMDARLHPEKALGVEIGDIHVVRNAGGRAVDALRSVTISQQLLGTTEIYILHHTDCGMLTFSTAQLQGIVKERLGADDGTVYHEFSDLEQSVRDDVALLRASPLVAPGTPITGGVYDVHTGKITWLE
ncbi:carbonic anhydrase [Micractinium conductrix]|uniref:Carbonic anhydrase n=1 Tax=Micractinium conductrix TaxID=554055 RepID=A0A2P6V1Z8_9CHLO|nr:carbonic anhydrase [Micractinium conductrix]|eukprot:PSC68112.1 carbonic anhydrase [Micractinium conductrix]